MSTTVFVSQRCFPETIAALESGGVDRILTNPHDQPLPESRRLESMAASEGMIAFMPDRIGADELDQAPALRVIAGALKGFDNIDLEACRNRSVTVTYVPELLTVPTAELAVGLILALNRKILFGDRIIREEPFRAWRPIGYGLGLDGSTVGTVGFGAVGRAIAA
jgi:phosphonate dehydrogenase